MRGSPIMGCILGLTWMFAASLPAGAQTAAGNAVECRSQNYQRSVCDYPYRRAELVRQISKTACVEGRTWGLRRGRLWVDEGCAGAFAPPAEHVGSAPVPGPGHAGAAVFECRSEDYKRARCGGNMQGAVLVQQLSRSDCIEGRTWGVDRRGLWVDQGCAGRFQPVHEHAAGGGQRPSPLPDSQVIECRSRDGRASECRLPIRVSQVNLYQQLSRTPCERGRNWDWQGQTVRVWNGCGAVFRFFPR